MHWLNRLEAGCALLAAACLLTVTTGCDKEKATAGATAAGPVKVEVAAPVEQDVTDFQDFTGRLEAVESVEIRARVSGYLTKVAFDPSIELGAEVQEGDLLFEIDDRPYQNALSTAEAQLAKASAELKTTTAILARTEELFKKNVAPKEELERDTGNKLMADAAVQAANAAIAQAKLDLEFSKIQAPISGRISREQLTVGNLVTTSTGPLTNIVSVDPIQVYFDMDEPTLLTLQALRRAGKLKSPMEGEIPVLLGLAIDDGHPHEGKLDFVENQIDPNTGTIKVRGVFANPKSERGPRTFAPGMFARIRLPLGEPHKAVLVPERAIGRDQGQAFVFVVNAENEVVYRRIKPGALHEGLRVITEGLHPGERIVVNGLQRVRPGVKVAASAVEGQG